MKGLLGFVGTCALLYWAVKFIKARHSQLEVMPGTDRHFDALVVTVSAARPRPTSGRILLPQYSNKLRNQRREPFQLRHRLAWEIAEHYRKQGMTVVAVTVIGADGGYTAAINEDSRGL